MEGSGKPVFSLSSDTFIRALTLWILDSIYYLRGRKARPVKESKAMENHHDVIIVGARCAGATLAALLAKSGVRVLLLEAAPRGTDMPMSTHFVQPPGMDVLDTLGVGDKVRRAAPPSKRFRL